MPARQESVMSVADTLAASIAIGNKIDVLWNIFIAVHFGIFTLYHFVTRKKFNLTYYERAVFVIAYSFFLFLNGNALRTSYRLLYEIDEFLQMLLASPENTSITFAVYYNSIDYSARPILVVFTHLSAFTSVMLGVLFRHKLLRVRPQTAGQQADHALPQRREL